MSNRPKDKWIKCISVGGNIRGIVIQSSNLVNEINTQHGYTGRTAEAMGEVATASLLLGSYCKPGERINLQIQSSSDTQKAFADASCDGEVRGYIRVRKDEEKLSLGEDSTNQGPWKDGLLTVLRAFSDPDLNLHPFQGTVPLATGHLAKDLTFYWVQSEQIPTAVGLKVIMKPDGKEVLSAGGFMVQVLGGASDEEVQMVEAQVQHLDQLSFDISPSTDPKKLLSTLFQDIAFQVVEEKPLSFKCSCSVERVENALLLLSKDDLEETVRDRDSDIEIQCDLCSKKYNISVERIKSFSK